MRKTLLAVIGLCAWGCAGEQQGSPPLAEQDEDASGPVLVQAHAQIETNDASAEEERTEAPAEESDPQDETGEQDPETGDDANPEQFEPEPGY